MIGRKKCSLLEGLNTSEAKLQTIMVSIYFIFDYYNYRVLEL